MQIYSSNESNALQDLRTLYDSRDKQDTQALKHFKVEHADERLYTDVALLQREAIRFIPGVNLLLGGK